MQVLPDRKDSAHLIARLRTLLLFDPTNRKFPMLLAVLSDPALCPLEMER
jgi:hypothetical protein